MFKNSKRFLIFGAAIAAAGALILLFINVYLQSAGVQQRIKQGAEAALGTPVTLENTSYTPWSGLVLRTIAVPDPLNPASNWVEANALRVRFALWPLLQRRFVVTECTLFAPKVLIRQLPDGTWMVPLPAAPPPSTKEPGAAPESPGRGVSFRSEFHGFRLRGGNAYFVDAHGRQVMELTKADISIAIGPDQTATGTFSVDEANISSLLQPRKIRGPFTWTGTTLELSQIEGSLAGGKLRGNVTVVVTEQPSFTLNASVTESQLKKLAEEAGGEPDSTDGLLNGNIHLQGDPARSDTLEGGGHFELVGAKLKPVDFLVQLGDLFNIDELQILELGQATADFTVGGGRIQVDDVTLKSENLILRGTGPIEFDGQMNLAARLMVNQKLQRQLKGVLGKNFVASEDPEYQQLPFSVTGRVDSPKTDLLDQLIGTRIGNDIGGLLKNFFRPPDRKKEKKDKKKE